MLVVVSAARTARGLRRRRYNTSANPEEAMLFAFRSTTVTLSETCDRKQPSARCSTKSTPSPRSTRQFAKLSITRSAPPSWRFGRRIATRSLFSFNSSTNCPYSSLSPRSQKAGYDFSVVFQGFLQRRLGMEIHLLVAFTTPYHPRPDGWQGLVITTSHTDAMLAEASRCSQSAPDPSVCEDNTAHSLDPSSFCFRLHRLWLHISRSEECS